MAFQETYTYAPPVWPWKAGAQGQMMHFDLVVEEAIAFVVECGAKLADSLRGRIQYFATSYSKCPDHEGRAAVRLDGEEILKLLLWYSETSEGRYLQNN